MNREECITTLILHGLEPVMSAAPPTDLFVCRRAIDLPSGTAPYLDAYCVKWAHKDGGAWIEHCFLPLHSVRFPEANWNWFDTVDLELLASSNAVLGKINGP